MEENNPIVKEATKIRILDLVKGCSSLIKQLRQIQDSMAATSLTMSLFHRFSTTSKWPRVILRKNSMSLTEIS